MNTIRHRRALSLHRRLGPQCPPDVVAGRSQRHALGWRDLQPPQAIDGRGAVLGAALGAAAWAAMLLVMLHVAA